MKRRDSEVEAYIFIRDKLEELGWNPKNPARSPEGEVYTQNQALEHNELQKALDKDRPENIVKISETKYWIIEAKNKRDKIEQAVEEAKEYANDVNERGTIESVIISGVAGNDADKYVVENYYIEDGEYKEVEINNESTSALLSPDIVERVIDTGSASLEDFPIDEEYFISKAEEINEILHDGSIHENRRAKVISALLLSLIESEPDLDSKPKLLIQDINNRIEAALEKEDKSEFKHQIQLGLPTSDNHIKFANALVRTIRELKDLNIKSAMNSSTDVLGEFYEVFLKYGDSGQGIGIVLTPRHITNFAAEVTDIDSNDIVYDPSCGTGGFLVAAFDKVKNEANKDQRDKFKENKIFGVDQEPQVLSLAVVNMIFRGDGKNNIKEANCFHNHLDKTTKNGVESAEYVKDSDDYDEAVTKVLMNPPFSLNDPEEKSFKFVERTLQEIQDGGILFSVMPYSSLVKQGRYKKWRGRMLEDHTLRAVITLPKDLFYPVGTETAAVIIEKGRPHQEEDNVLWVRADKDGRDKVKGKRVPVSDVPNKIDQVRPVVKSFINAPTVNIEEKSKLQIADSIDFDDSKLELVPEAYLEEDNIKDEDLARSIDDLLRTHIGFEIREEPRLRKAGFDEDIELNKKEKEPVNYNTETKSFELSEIFDIETGKYHSVNDLYEGDTPLISCKTDDNGIKEFYEIPEENTHEDAITVTYDGQPLTAKYHNYRFAAYDNVGVFEPKEEYSKEVMLFLTVMINREKWRYSYGRKCYKKKIGDVEIELPVDDNGDLDTEFIKAVITKRDKFGYLEKN